MILHPITAKKKGGPIVVHVEAVKKAEGFTGTALPCAGVVFRYDSNEVDSERVGEFRTETPDVPLGDPKDNSDHVFLISGAVIHVDDPLPTPYVVLLSVKQDGTTLYMSVPEENGHGTIQDKSQMFLHLLKLVAA